MVYLDGVEACIDRYEAALDGEGAEARAVPARGRLPANGVSYLEAESACRAAGYRLCDGDEWTRACAGEEGRLYPYGPRYVSGACRNAEFERPTDGPVPGGSIPTCASPEGVYDLAGNVAEWTTETDPSGRLRDLRGGAYGDLPAYAKCEMGSHAFQPPEQRFAGQGFRCCADPTR